MGIGEAIAKAMIAEGAQVMVCSREASRAQETAQRIGAGAHPAACDVRSAEQVVALVEAAKTKFGRIDIWVNNAGHGLLDSVAVMDMQICRQMFETNLFGAIECMQAVIPIMQQQGGGCIVNISSVAGHISVPYMSAYCASKHALNAISKAARLENEAAKIHVMTVCPGYIKTAFAVNAVKGHDSRRLGESVRRGITAERVAKAVVHGIVRRKREVVVPASDRVKIKLYQMFPSLVEGVMMRLVEKVDQASMVAERMKKS